ncbi:MAG TPA: hypothetical protein VFJ16_18775 [Longimicrobium sp.]|nr:hypothetical protein [Longimicrobium sp.]
MTELQKRNAIRLYFTPFPKWSLGFIVFGTLCLLPGGGTGLVLGVLFVGVGAAVLFVRARGIGDAEFDRYRDEDLRNAAAKAVQRWGIDESDLVGKPVRVFGPALGATSTQAAKKGADRFIRFNPIRFAVLGFCEHQLLAYLGVLDMVTGNVLLEETEEYFYRDVVAVATKTDSIEFTHKGTLHQLNDTQTFVLTTSGATSIRVPLRSLQLASILGGGEMPTTQAEEAIAAVRAMLRQKKSGVPI